MPCMQQFFLLQFFFVFLVGVSENVDVGEGKEIREIERMKENLCFVCLHKPLD